MASILKTFLVLSFTNLKTNNSRNKAALHLQENKQYSKTLLLYYWENLKNLFASIDALFNLKIHSWDTKHMFFQSTDRLQNSIQSEHDKELYFSFDNIL